MNDIETPQLAYSIKRFCKAADISQRHYYALQGRGKGPAITRLGGRVVITVENGKRWLQEYTSVVG